MSKIVDLILKGSKYKLTSKFGSRTPISTKAGTSSNYHKGCDYGTYSKKVPVYAIENGTVDSVGKASDGALYVIIKYPRLNKLFRHWHLSSYCVKKGQSVSKGTKIGVTGMTGKATGIHLHLGIVDIATSCYIDPEEYAKTYSEIEITGSTINSTNFLGEKGYFEFGDIHTSIGKIAEFMRKCFPAYTKKEALGDKYGKYLKASLDEFKKRTKLNNNGRIDETLIKELKKYGFKE